MYASFNVLRGFDAAACDGRIGHVTDLFFDDSDWRNRYLVVDTSDWIGGPLVTIPAQALRRIDVERKEVDLDLDREAARHSPDVDAHRPISRRREMELADYFKVTPHWLDGDDGPQACGPVDADEVHLRSAREVEGYRVRARDGEIGHIIDFLVDDRSLAIRHVVVHTAGWLHSRDVVLAPSHALGIDWALRTVQVDLTRAQVEQSPRYDTHKPLDVEHERRVSEFWQRFLSNLT